MSNAILNKIQQLIASGDVRISERGYDELADGGLTAREVISDIANAILVEDYPTYHKVPASLYYNTIATAIRSTSFGAFPKARTGQLCLS